MEKSQVRRFDNSSACTWVQAATAGNHAAAVTPASQWGYGRDRHQRCDVTPAQPQTHHLGFTDMIQRNAREHRSFDPRPARRPLTSRRSISFASQACGFDVSRYINTIITRRAARQFRAVAPTDPTPNGQRWSRMRRWSNDRRKPIVGDTHA